MTERYKNECKQIKQNAEYTAETHHVIADRSKKLSFWLEVVPAVVAAVTGSLVAAGIAPIALLWLTVLGAVTSAIANVLNPKKDYYDHLNAAKHFTVLKHDARALQETFSVRMNEDQFCDKVEHLHQRYNDLVSLVPPTDDKAFMKARTKIQGDIHTPDLDSKGKIK